MTRALALQMADDATALGASVNLYPVDKDSLDWRVTVNRSQGITAQQIANVQTKYGVVGTTNTVTFA